jgi:hypothetical protein
VISGRQRVLVATPSLQISWSGELQRLGGANRRSGAEVILLDPASFAGSQPVPPDGAGRVGLNSAEAYQSFLISVGMPTRILRRGDLHPRAGSYGDLNRWDFLTMPTGKAVARHTPRRFIARLADAGRPVERSGE